MDTESCADLTSSKDSLSQSRVLHRSQPPSCSEVPRTRLATDSAGNFHALPRSRFVRIGQNQHPPLTGFRPSLRNEIAHTARLKVSDLVACVCRPVRRSGSRKSSAFVQLHATRDPPSAPRKRHRRPPLRWRRELTQTAKTGNNNRRALPRFGCEVFAASGVSGRSVEQWTDLLGLRRHLRQLCLRHWNCEESTAHIEFDGDSARSTGKRNIKMEKAIEHRPQLNPSL